MVLVLAFGVIVNTSAMIFLSQCRSTSGEIQRVWYGLVIRLWVKTRQPWLTADHEQILCSGCQSVWLSNTQGFSKTNDEETEETPRIAIGIGIGNAPGCGSRSGGRVDKCTSITTSSPGNPWGSWCQSAAYYLRPIALFVSDHLVQDRHLFFSARDARAGD